jgi:hypothetical protein
LLQTFRSYGAFFIGNNTALTQISIYGAACSICFANLNIHEQEAKPKNNGMKIIDNHGVII